MEMVDTNNKILIYVLKHPVTLEVRYVGMTSKTLKQRFRKHMDNVNYTGHNPYLCNWINSILKQGYVPIMECIDEVSLIDWQEKERFYISQFPNLLNATEGGEGSFGFKHSQAAIAKIRLLKTGKKASVETKLKRSKSLKGRIISEKHRERIGIANRGKIYTLLKIKCYNIISKESFIFNTAKEVSKYFECGMTTVYRLLRTKAKFRGRFVFSRVSEDIV